MYREKLLIENAPAMNNMSYDKNNFLTLLRIIITNEIPTYTVYFKTLINFLSWMIFFGNFAEIQLIILVNSLISFTKDWWNNFAQFDRNTNTKN